MEIMGINVLYFNVDDLIVFVNMFIVKIFNYYGWTICKNFLLTMFSKMEMKKIVFSCGGLSIAIILQSLSCVFIEKNNEKFNT
jgi:uncharacterized protein YacL